MIIIEYQTITNHAQRTWYDEAPSKGAKNISISYSTGVTIWSFKVIETDGMLKPNGLRYPTFLYPVLRE